MSLEIYKALIADPLGTLQEHVLTVNQLPPQDDGTAAPLWLAAGTSGIVIDSSKRRAEGMARADDDDAIQRRMLVSPMRGPGLPTGQRLGRTRIVQAAHAAKLWVTEMQNGCTVLILDWGGHAYSMVHLQPSNDAQFNRVGRGIMSIGSFFLKSYKNAWLKQEATTVVDNSASSRVPHRYIMVQTMFEAARGATQIIGVKRGLGFKFYRQLQPYARDDQPDAERLEWYGWYPYIPYRSY